MKAYRPPFATHGFARRLRLAAVRGREAESEGGAGKGFTQAAPLGCDVGLA
jgi:hypothetical protein